MKKVAFSLLALTSTLGACDMIRSLKGDDAPPPAVAEPASEAEPAPAVVDETPIPALPQLPAELLVDGAYSITQFDDSTPHIVGTPTAQGMKTNGEEGYLLFGPYAAFDAGTYRLLITGVAPQPGDAVVDVTSGAGAATYVSGGLQGVEGTLFNATVELPEAVTDLEIRAYVTPYSDMTITGILFAPAM